MSTLSTITSGSIWPVTAEIPDCPVLTSDTTADVAIVGAGISGLTTAYLLARRGKKVVVVDDGPVASGQTQMTTAHLSNAIDDRYVEIERLHGPQGARLAGDSHTAAIATIEQIIREEKIACDFARVDGYLFTPPDDTGDLLEREFAAAQRAGVAVERAAKAPLASFDTGACLRFTNQGQFHPLKYLSGMVAAIRRHGGLIYTQTHAKHVEGGDSARVESSRGPVIKCGAIVVATNTPINDLVAIHTKQAPYMSYVIACRVPRDSITRALYWDTMDPYHYVRLQSSSGAGEADGHAGHELLIVGGEDHKTGQATDGAERFARLELWARTRFPMIESVDYHWSGQVMESVDGLAFIGRNPMDKDNVYVATGDSGMGMTHGTIAGLLLTELILGNDHPWRELYNPSRVPVRALARFTRENLNVAAEYGAWLTGGDVSSEDEIAEGEGAVIRQGLSKIAVYRGPDGQLTRCSAVCPHLKCIVVWNQVESTWDCPCHGSRFDPLGKVISGPANSDLPPVEVKE